MQLETICGEQPGFHSGTRGPWELSPLFHMSWIYSIRWQMELQRLYPVGTLLKVLCPLGVANVMLSFQESDPFPLYKQVS